MYIYYNIQTNQFITREHLSPKGKITTGKVGQFEFFKAYSEYSLQLNARQSQLRVISEKMKQEQDEAVKAAYNEEFKKLLAQQDLQPPQNRKMIQVRMRVVGYNNEGTIVEPCDIRNFKLLQKNGYYQENIVNKEAESN